MNYIRIIFILLFVNFIFTGCVSKFASLTETGTIDDIKQEIKTQKDKQVALCWASYYGKIDKVEYLLKNGADINDYDDGTDLWNISPAIVGASVNNKIDMVKYLVKNGADVNKLSRTGHTAISLAASWGYLDIVQYLVENGANLYIGHNTIKILKSNKNEYLIPVLLKIQEDKKLKKDVIALEDKKIIIEKQQLINTEKQKDKVNLLIKNKDFEGLKEYTDKYPNSVNFISQAELRLALTGPKGVKVGDIRKYIKDGKSELIILSLIKRVKVPYKEFTIEEIETLQSLGLSDKIISTMIDVTTLLLRDEKLRKQQEYFLNEQKKIANQKTRLIYQNTKTQKVDAQGNPIVEKLQDELIKQGVSMLLDQLF